MSTIATDNPETILNEDWAYLLEHQGVTRAFPDEQTLESWRKDMRTLARVNHRKGLHTGGGGARNNEGNLVAYACFDRRADADAVEVLRPAEPSFAGPRRQPCKRGEYIVIALNGAVGPQNTVIVKDVADYEEALNFRIGKAAPERRDGDYLVTDGTATQLYRATRGGRKIHRGKAFA